MAPRIPRERKVHIAVTVIAGISALLLGLVMGSASGDGGPPTGEPEGVGPRREVGGVGVGFEHSKAGASAAVASFQSAFASPAILRPSVLRRRIALVASPDYEAQMLAANSPGARRIAGGPIGIGAREGLQTLYAAVPVGYRVESYSPRRARVLTWGFTLLGNAASVEPEAYFGISRTTLAWIEGDWKIASLRSGFGPTPRIETGGDRVGGFGLIELARGLKSYALAP